MYKYLFDKGRWYVVDGLCENDCVTPLRRPILLAKAIEMGLRYGKAEMIPRPLFTLSLHPFPTKRYGGHSTTLYSLLIS